MHDSPDVIRLIPHHLESQSLTNLRMRPIAANHVFRYDFKGISIAILKLNGHSIPLVHRLCIDKGIWSFNSITIFPNGLDKEPFEMALMKGRLRIACGGDGVGNSTGSDDFLRILGIWIPEIDFVH